MPPASTAARRSCQQSLEMVLASGNIPGQIGSYEQCVSIRADSSSRSGHHHPPPPPPANSGAGELMESDDSGSSSSSSITAGKTTIAGGGGAKYCMLLQSNTQIVHRVVGQCVPIDECSSTEDILELVSENPYLNNTFHLPLAWKGENSTIPGSSSSSSSSSGGGSNLHRADQQHQQHLTEVYCSDYEAELEGFGYFAIVTAISIAAFILCCTLYRYIKNTRTTFGMLFQDTKATSATNKEQQLMASSGDGTSLNVRREASREDLLNLTTSLLTASQNGSGASMSDFGGVNAAGGSSNNGSNPLGRNNSTSSGIQEPPSKARQALEKMAEAFSLIDSVPRWRSYVKDEPSNLFHSVRVFAWLWITLVDVFTYTQHIPSYNNEIHESSNVFYSLLVRRSAANFGIGTFVMLSGFSTAQLLYSDSNNQTLVQSLLEEQTTGVALFLKKAKWYMLLVARRWLRIVPLYGMVIFLVHSTLNPLGSGPFWATFVESAAMGKNCAGAGWLTNIFFINNVYPTQPNDRCFPWCFYFALEFQFFLLGPLVVWAYRVSSLRTAGVLAGLVVLISCVARGANALSSLPPSDPGHDNSNTSSSWGASPSDHHSHVIPAPPGGSNMTTMSPQHMTTTLAPSEGQSIFGGGSTLMQNDAAAGYFSYPDATEPWAMVIPWLTGVALYIFYSEIRAARVDHSLFACDTLNMRAQKGAGMEKMSLFILNKMKKKVFRICLIWGGVIIGVVVVILNWSLITSDWVSKSSTCVGCRVGIVVFQSFDILLWSLGSLALMLPMLLMYGGFLRRFLCHPLWSGLSKLVFAAYLVHPIVILFFNASRASPAQMHFLPFLYDSCGHMTLSLLVAFILHLCIEQPFIFLTTP